MDFATWEPIYERILEDFGFDRAGDEKAAMFLSGMLTEENTISLSEIKAIISGKPVLVCGNAPRLRSDLSEIDFWICGNCSRWSCCCTHGYGALCLMSSVQTLTAILKLILKNRSLHEKG